MTEAPPDGSRPPAPFIVGVGRSGTTLLRMMLDAHPSLAIPPETHLVADVLDASARTAGEETSSAVAAAVLASPRWPDFGLAPGDFRRELARARPRSAGDVLRVLYELYASRAGKPRWGDKTPPYLGRMHQIQELLPEARFVHIVRDGRDVALSIAPLWFGPDNVADVAEWWSRKIAWARHHARQLDWYLEVRYEDLVRDPPAALGRVCDFVDLDWDPAMLTYHRRARRRLADELGDLRWPDGRVIGATERASIHGYVGEAPREDRLERWRAEMDAADLRTFERVAGDTLRDLGYETR